jgi:hypothetical protein
MDTFAQSMRHVLYEHTLLRQVGRFHISLIVSFISSLRPEACSQSRYLNTIGSFQTRLKIPLSNNLRSRLYLEQFQAASPRVQPRLSLIAMKFVQYRLHDHGPVVSASALQRALLHEPSEEIASTRTKAGTEADR